MNDSPRSSSLVPLLPSALNSKKTLPYVDYSIGNEAKADPGLARVVFLTPKDLPAVAKALAQQPKPNPTRDHVISRAPSSSYANPTYHGGWSPMLKDM